MKYLFALLLSLSFCKAKAQFLPSTSVSPDIGYFSTQMLDINSDGHMDLIAAVTSGNKLVWHPNDGTGHFGAEIIIDDTDIISPLGLEIADLNGDGLTDIIVTTSTIFDGAPPYKMVWYENLGGGSFSAATLLASANVFDFGTSDLQGDGNLDIFYIFSTEAYWLQNDGTGSFSAPIALPSFEEEYVHIEAADFDNDGDDDFIIGTTDKTILIDNLGGGTFAAPSVILDTDFGSEHLREMRIADVNLDGLPDFIGLYEIGHLILCENLGGTLGPLSIIGHGGDGGASSSALVVKDLLLNDGYPEIIWGDAGYYGVNALLNSGGDFTTTANFFISELGISIASPNSINVLDLNYDGLQDILIDGVSLSNSALVFWNIDSTDLATASGTVFGDLNENGIFDADEISFSGFGIERTPYFGTNFTNHEGKYTFSLGGEEGLVYTFTPNFSDHWEITSPYDSYDVELVHGTLIDTLDFGLYPLLFVDSISSSHVNRPFRCLSDQFMQFKIKNEGTTLPAGIVELELDDSLTFISAEIIPDSVIDQTVYWSYDSLNWFSEINYRILVQTPHESDDTLVSHIRASIDSLGGAIFTVEDSILTRITCAFDPNDKSVTPAGLTEEGYIPLPTEQLQYTVRFQNTGTDTALNVVIRDQLDPNLDWSSLTPISSSHDMTVGVSMDGLATFTFNGIMLPDSNINEPASHGFFNYSINLNEDLVVGTVINNRADIYFDHNPPVLTNVTKTTLYSCESFSDNVTLSALHNCFGDTIYAEVEEIPEFVDFTWYLNGELVEDSNLEITASGIHELTTTISTPDCVFETDYSLSIFDEIVTELEVAELCTGDSLFIFDTYQKEPGIYRHTFASEITGCDSTLVQELIVNELPTVNFIELDDSLICVNENAFSVYGTPSGGEFLGSGIAGETFDPTIAGEGIHILYYQYADSNDCSTIDSTQIRVVDCLGIDENTLTKIKVYPTVFENYTTLYFEQPLTEAHVLIIHDIYGKKVYENENVLGKTFLLEKNKLSSGMYTLILLDSDKEVIYTTKIFAK